MRQLILNFELGQLTEVTFQESPGSPARVCVRGKTSGPRRQAGSFQWTAAVKALSLLIVKTALSPDNALVKGDDHSLAASLDYAISKQPMWLTEMFGSDSNGISLSRRLILRTNPERKRPGPVTLGINQLYLSPGAISIHVDGKLCCGQQLVGLYNELEGLEPIKWHSKAA